jgi:NhaA family Na+:H+ antiporter
VIAKPLLLWINDGLMAIFFFVVGLEIKREVLAGELSSVRKAAFPVIAAVGGMVVPAGLYVLLNRSGPEARGWGVPMATDIAFALGVLALLGSRAPTSLKIFLTAFAIADDIGAVLVIALFYTESIAWGYLGLAAGCLVLLVALNAGGARRPLTYVVLGLVLWVAFLKSGVHATVAGVLLAMTIPATARIDYPAFLQRGRSVLDQFERADTGDGEAATHSERQAALHTLEEACEHVQTPLHRIEHALHPWVTFAIMPVFALANAGVTLGGGGGVGHPVALGVLLGLVLGKPIGITFFAWLAVRLGLAELPPGITWQHVHGAGWLGGIGFTMALFIAGLAFAGTPYLDTAKLGILSASLVAGVVGFVLLRGTAPPARDG